MEVTIQPPRITEFVQEDGTGRVEVSASWQISAKQARRTAGRLAGEHVSLLLIGGEPELSVGERVVWRVPITLQLGINDPVEVVGRLSIDANTGEPIGLEEDLLQVRKNTRLHAQRSPALAVPAG